ncbi:hypothetical protein Y1Q_0003321 [Alligator mississippiensis]|uniref:Uncharacterized protein n=1 Tax=Alligator mississippiensis TaxID=8496 RepID=A0A151MEB5_ALLMI|nr:hypothetical protein Y1Q_0003321 [Alligator mississippiensis]
MPATSLGVGTCCQTEEWSGPAGLNSGLTGTSLPDCMKQQRLQLNPQGFQGREGTERGINCISAWLQQPIPLSSLTEVSTSSSGSPGQDLLCQLHSPRPSHEVWPAMTPLAISSASFSPGKDPAWASAHHTTPHHPRKPARATFHC